MAIRTAILIGGSVFPAESGLPSLQCPDHDVDGLQQILGSDTHWPYRCITLKNKPHFEVLPVVYEELHNRENELVLIYYSGHGKLDLAGRLHLCSSNTVLKSLPASSIPAETIRQYLDTSPIRQTVLILDCCFSGSIDNAFKKKGSVEDQTQATLDRNFDGKGIYVLTASTAIQTAHEKDGHTNSVFTTHLIKALKEADKDGDGYISVDEIYGYIYNQMRADPNQLQLPMHWDFGGLGMTCLVKTGKDPLEELYKRAKARLMKLYEADTLSHSLVIAAAELVKQQKEELDPIRQKQRELTLLLVESKVTTSEFIERWYEPIEKPPIDAPRPMKPGPLKLSPQASPTQPGPPQGFPQAPPPQSSSQKEGKIQPWSSKRLVALILSFIALAVIVGVISTVTERPENSSASGSFQPTVTERPKNSFASGTFRVRPGYVPQPEHFRPPKHAVFNKATAE